MSGRVYHFNEIPIPSVTTILDILDKPALVTWAAKMTSEYAFEKFAHNFPKDISDVHMVLDDAKKNFRAISEKAKDIGSETHELIEKHIKSVLRKESIDVTKDKVIKNEVQNAYLAFLQWEGDNGVEWHESEKNVFDVANLRSAGTADAVATFHKGDFSGQTPMIDFKSSSGFWDGYDMQVSAYRDYRTKCNGLKGVLLERYDGETYTIDYPVLNIDSMGILRLDKVTGLPEYKDYSKYYERSLKAFEHLCDFYYAFKKRRLKGNPNAA
jgi:hypothetical protein